MPRWPQPAFWAELGPGHCPPGTRAPRGVREGRQQCPLRPRLRRGIAPRHVVSGSGEAGGPAGAVPPPSSKLRSEPAAARAGALPPTESPNKCLIPVPNPPARAAAGSPALGPGPGSRNREQTGWCRPGLTTPAAGPPSGQRWTGHGKPEPVGARRSPRASRACPRPQSRLDAGRPAPWVSPRRSTAACPLPCVARRPGSGAGLRYDRPPRVGPRGARRPPPAGPAWGGPGPGTTGTGHRPGRSERAPSVRGVPLPLTNQPLRASVLTCNPSPRGAVASASNPRVSPLP